MAQFHGIEQPLFAAPALDNNFLGQVGAQDFVPAHHDFAALLQHGQHPAVEVGLQLVLVHGFAVGLYHAPLPHKGRNARAAPPLPSVVFVAADVEVRVGKQRRHLGEQRIEQRIRGFPGGVNGNVGGAEAAVHPINGVVGGQPRVGRNPAGGVAGHVKLGQHPDAARRRVSNDVPHLLLGVIAVGAAHLVQARQHLAFHPEALVVGEVPVQHVQLHRRHAIDVSFDDSHRQEVPRGVHQQPAPGKPRLVPNVHFGQVALPLFRDGQLLQRGQGPQHPQAGGRVDAHAHGRHAQAVALLVKLFGLAHPTVADLQHRTGGRLGRRGPVQAAQQAGGRRAHGRVQRTFEPKFERSFQAQAALAPAHLGGHRHEGVGRLGQGRKRGKNRQYQPQQPCTAPCQSPHISPLALNSRYLLMVFTVKSFGAVSSE